MHRVSNISQTPNINKPLPHEVYSSAQTQEVTRRLASNIENWNSYWKSVQKNPESDHLGDIYISGEATLNYGQPVLLYLFEHALLEIKVKKRWIKKKIPWTSESVCSIIRHVETSDMVISTLKGDPLKLRIRHSNNMQLTDTVFPSSADHAAWLNQFQLCLSPPSNPLSPPSNPVTVRPQSSIGSLPHTPTTLYDPPVSPVTDLPPHHDENAYPPSYAPHVHDAYPINPNHRHTNPWSINDYEGKNEHEIQAHHRNNVRAGYENELEPSLRRRDNPPVVNEKLPARLPPMRAPETYAELSEDVAQYETLLRRTMSLMGRSGGETYELLLARVTELEARLAALQPSVPDARGV